MTINTLKKRKKINKDNKYIIGNNYKKQKTKKKININKNISHNILKKIQKLYTSNSNKNIYLLLLHPLFFNADKHNIISRNTILKQLEQNIILKQNITLSRKQALGLNYNINILQNPTTYSFCVNQINNQGYISSIKTLNNSKTLNNLQVLLIKDISLEKLKSLFIDTNYRTILSGKLMYDVAKTLFNDNSLMFLEEQLTKRFISKISKDTLKKLMEYKKYLDDNIDIRDHDKFMILGGNVLSVYGLRKATDLDLIISNRGKEYTNNFNGIIEKDFIDSKRKHTSWDVIHPELKWKPIYKKFHKQWANSVGANSIIECIHNPKYHFYFLGLKFIILDLEIYRRNIRNRPAAVADLIAINELLFTNKKEKIVINPISRNYIYILDNEVKEVYSSNQEFIKSVNYHLKNKYNIHLSLSKISKMLKFKD